jgi:hypothetical protein
LAPRMIEVNTRKRLLGMMGCSTCRAGREGTSRAAQQGGGHVKGAGDCKVRKEAGAQLAWRLGASNAAASLEAGCAGWLAGCAAV